MKRVQALVSSLTVGPLETIAVLLLTLFAFEARAAKVTFFVEKETERIDAAYAEALKTGALFTPDVLAAIETAATSLNGDLRAHLKLRLLVGDVNAPRIGLKPAPNLLFWSYQNRTLHKLSGERGEHEAYVILPNEALDARKFKNALATLVYRGVFHERMRERYPKNDLFVPSVTFSVAGYEPSLEYQTLELRRSVIAKFVSNAEWYFAMAALRLDADEQTRADIDTYMKPHVAFRGLVTFVEREGLPALADLLGQSVDRALAVTRRWPTQFAELDAAEAQWAGPPIRDALITAIRVNLRARASIRSCKETLAGRVAPLQAPGRP